VALLALLPDEFPGAMAEANFHYYEPRCAHGSSLSTGMHALVAARLGDMDMALRYLRRAAAADLELDPKSAGGIRIAGLGAVWQAVVLGFAGLDLSGETISINPRLPRQWRSISFTVRWRGRLVRVRIAGTTAFVAISDGEPVQIRIAGKTHSLKGGASVEVQLEPAAAVPP
jgi:trehalose/maltose hydrolase-like predicted phosphorylase